jgi:lysophospholipase
MYRGSRHCCAPMSTADDTVRIEEEPFPATGVTLYRRSAYPAGGVEASLALLHGYGEHSGRHLHFMRWMAARGVACHALDFRGQGRASGRRGFVVSWDDYLEDLQAFLALRAVGDTRRGGPFFVLGHSHGALILGMAGIRGLVDAAGCVMTAPYFRAKMAVPPHKIAAARLLNPVLPWLGVPSGLRDEWMSADERMVQDSRADALIVRTATPRWYLGALRAQAEVLRRAGEFRLPLLVLMGDADPVADPRLAHEFFSRAGSEDKTYHPLPDHLHELLREAGRERIFQQILKWIVDRL